eukprot:CAMPEP_0194137338 /NCGR_PEP_ID=MMETSP0152-20130528/7238_1 /TAXON_ID=1049557 /ORGANISM="Thalassiothrix antarctica, Strain L6-D1" /LENGTH=563 /DNA_ID=CAMNT_0038834319 /DNA_START=22 /DNA_END=1713 /DNA_ORIENTATION=-
MTMKGLLLHLLILCLSLCDLINASNVANSCENLNFDSWTKNEVVIEIHRNGETNSCGSFMFSSEDLATWDLFQKCPSDLSKYDVEAFLSYLVMNKLDTESCLNEDDPDPTPGFLGYCDRGEEYTPILTDHDSLIHQSEEHLPCRFFTREGLRISSLKQLTNLAVEKDQACSEGQLDCGRTAHIHIYAVSAGRVFMFAPSYIGEIFELSEHVKVTSGLPVYAEVLNLNPRVFDIHNFFSKEESADLVDRALAETSESHKIKRSTTGTGENHVFNKRTSDNGFDTHGKTAMKVKRRCMRILGFDEYIEGHTDGLQILRYNTSKAYTTHMDYMVDKSGSASFDYDSEFKGGNRFATILLYMTDLEEGEGGETVFAESWPPTLPESERRELPEALTDLRSSNASQFLKQDSWEEQMVATCRSKFSVRPNSARAVLFYSQLPNGKEDTMSLHGGCPVLSDKPKWAANLWAWNTPRQGYPGAPFKGEEPPEVPTPTQLKATFTNSGTNSEFESAQLYYDETQYWGEIGFTNKPLTAYTYVGHKWNIKVGNEFVKQFLIESEEDLLDFII